MDLRANIEEPITLGSLERALVPTGIFIELPVGYEAQIRPRSGLATKHGISVINSPGTVDADFRGELKVSLVNLSDKLFTIEPGERIAQMVVARHERVEWETVEELSKLARAGGWAPPRKVSNHSTALAQHCNNKAADSLALLQAAASATPSNRLRWRTFQSPL